MTQHMLTASRSDMLKRLALSVLMVFLVAAFLYAFMPDSAFANSTTPAPTTPADSSAGPNSPATGLTAGICTMITWFSGNLGKGLASLAVITVGLGALFGKVEWKTAIIVAVGISLIFGAVAVFNAMNPGLVLNCQAILADAPDPDAIGAPQAPPPDTETAASPPPIDAPGAPPADVETPISPPPLDAPEVPPDLNGSGSFSSSS